MRTCFVCVVLASLVVLRPAGQEQKPAAAKDRASAEMTLTGCLRTSSTAEAARPVYTLEVDSSSSSVPATGTAGREATAPKKKISLSADASVALEKHVGHQVKLTGELLQPPSMPEAQAKPLPGDADGTFRVSAVKMISETCR